MNHQRSRLDEDRTEQCWSPEVEPSIADACEHLFRPLQRLRPPAPRPPSRPLRGLVAASAVRREQIHGEVVALIAIPVPIEVRVVEGEAVAAERRANRRQRAAGPRLTKHIDLPRRAHVDTPCSIAWSWTISPPISTQPAGSRSVSSATACHNRSVGASPAWMTISITTPIGVRPHGAPGGPRSPAGR